MKNFEDELRGLNSTEFYESGVKYLNGADDFPEDYEKALMCFIKALDFGNASAMKEIGYMYECGFGVNQNIDEAIKMLYVIPDTHLGHENIKKYCNRPNNFKKLIETNWQATVTATDTVIHLGDISFNEEWIERLGSWNGKKILVRGNHDRKPYEFYMNCEFTAVVEEVVIDIKNVVMLFSHRPRFGHDYNINIHGHQHNLAVYDSQRLYLPLSLEHMGYKLLALDEDFIKTRREYPRFSKQWDESPILTV